jgi:hypothetical protein
MIRAERGFSATLWKTGCSVVCGVFLPVIFMQKHSTKPQGDKYGLQGTLAIIGESSQ